MKKLYFLRKLITIAVLFAPVMNSAMAAHGVWLTSVDANSNPGVYAQIPLHQGLSSNPPPLLADAAPSLILLSFALFAFGLLKIYSTVISSIRANRKPAYVRLWHSLRNPHSRN